MGKYLNSRTIIALGLVFAFLVNSLGPLPAYAQGVADLPLPGTMVNLSSAFEPVLIKGLKVHLDNPFLFDFIIDTGNTALQADDAQLKEESNKLIKYFLAAMTVPEKDLWVNLSPYEKDRIIAPNLGQTEMGRDMLAQDYILKQLTASLIYPEKHLGKEFWDRVYSKAQQMYGTTQIPVNTFNKVWIVADRADVYERGNVAYVVGAHLKVMLEEDYLAKEKHQNTQAASVSSQVVRSIILPAIEHEVNAGQNFAPLRQMFYSMILASWYKMALKDAILTQIYGNQSKVKVGVNQDDPKANEEIFQRYLKAYKKGVFNYIKEDVDQTSQQPIPRKYFSGGTNFESLGSPAMLHRHMQWNADAETGENFIVTVNANIKSAKPKDAAMTASVQVVVKNPPLGIHAHPASHIRILALYMKKKLGISLYLKNLETNEVSPADDILDLLSLRIFDNVKVEVVANSSEKINKETLEAALDIVKQLLQDKDTLERPFDDEGHKYFEQIDSLAKFADEAMKVGPAIDFLSKFWKFKLESNNAGYLYSIFNPQSERNEFRSPIPQQPGLGNWISIDRVVREQQYLGKFMSEDGRYPSRINVQFFVPLREFIDREYPTGVVHDQVIGFLDEFQAVFGQVISDIKVNGLHRAFLEENKSNSFIVQRMVLNAHMIKRLDMLQQSLENAHIAQAKEFVIALERLVNSLFDIYDAGFVYLADGHWYLAKYERASGGMWIETHIVQGDSLLANENQEDLSLIKQYSSRLAYFKEATARLLLQGIQTHEEASDIRQWLYDYLDRYQQLPVDVHSPTDFREGNGCNYYRRAFSCACAQNVGICF